MAEGLTGTRKALDSKASTTKQNNKIQNIEMLAVVLDKGFSREFYFLCIPICISYVFYEYFFYNYF
jgi:hypothetical protein